MTPTPSREHRFVGPRWKLAAPAVPKPIGVDVDRVSDDFRGPSRGLEAIGWRGCGYSLFLTRHSRNQTGDLYHDMMPEWA